jgi:DNA polymerase III epsilon subunit-like protein
MRRAPQEPVALPPPSASSLRPESPGLPGRLCLRAAVPPPAGYAVFDCETTGVRPDEDEIVSLALVLLDPDGAETGTFSSLVRPTRPIPPEATAVHGLNDGDVAGAPPFARLSGRLLELLADRVFVAHNVRFDLPLLRHAFVAAGSNYRPAAVACTLDVFRLLEPLAASHRLESICERHQISLAAAHHATSDVLAAAALIRLVLAMDLAPESARLDQSAYLRLRSRGDTRPASDPQVRRVFALAGAAGFTGADGRSDRGQVCELVRRVAGVDEPELLTREQVQTVYDRLEELIEANEQAAVARSA